MTHTATLTLPLEQVDAYIGLVQVALHCKPVEIKVEYRYRAGLPADHEGPAEKDVFAAMSARLTRAISLNDAADTMSLIVSAGTDILPYLGARQLDWIEENLPVPSAT